ncbi:hypothetical protein [Acetobacter okinawensis]|nr:hypothetical protein [Acetobacter okinawensis]
MSADFECGMVLGGYLWAGWGVVLAVALRLLAQRDGGWPNQP